MTPEQQAIIEAAEDWRLAGRDLPLGVEPGPERDRLEQAVEALWAAEGPCLRSYRLIVEDCRRAGVA